MSSLAPPQQPAPPAAPAQPPPQPPPAQQDDDDLVAAAAAVLALAVTAAVAAALLEKLYTARADVEQAALLAALQIIMAMPPEASGIAGPATAQISRLNLVRRGQMVLSTARRLTADVRRARSENRSVIQALLDGVARERRYYGMHRTAIWDRARAAMAVDMAALQYGLLLGWYTHRDDRTTPDCLAADGRNFRADVMPIIGFPGTVHAKCRCRPGAPHPHATTLPSETPLQHRIRWATERIQQATGV